MRPYTIVVRLGGRGYRTLSAYLAAVEQARHLAAAAGREVEVVDADHPGRPLIVVCAADAGTSSSRRQSPS